MCYPKCRFLSTMLPVLVVLLEFSASASAMTCRRPTPTEHIETTPIIFYGYPENGAGGPKDMKVREVTFKVLRAYKGVEGDRVSIRYENDHGANMGWGFRDNSATLVFAQKSRSSKGASGELSYCNMITYHGRPNLHAEYWDVLAGMKP